MTDTPLLYTNELGRMMTQNPSGAAAIPSILLRPSSRSSSQQLVLTIFHPMSSSSEMKQPPSVKEQTSLIILLPFFTCWILAVRPCQRSRCSYRNPTGTYYRRWRAFSNHFCISITRGNDWITGSFEFDVILSATCHCRRSKHSQMTITRESRYLVGTTTLRLLKSLAPSPKKDNKNKLIG